MIDDMTSPAVPVDTDANNDAVAIEPVRVSQAMEDYLKAAYRLEQDGAPVSTQRLADELGFSGPSVTNMVKRLDELKLLKHSRYHGVTLTPAGQHVALEVIRHHRLLELYLAEALGYDWDEVHEEAERLEHHVSEELEQRMERVLGYPQFDPHGDPIPSKTGTLPTVDDIALTDVGDGVVGKVSRVSDRDAEQLRHLASLGVKPGVTLRVIGHLPFEGPIHIEIDGTEQMLSLTLARGIRFLPQT